jgi:hypothetical protein
MTASAMSKQETGNRHHHPAGRLLFHVSANFRKIVGHGPVRAVSMGPSARWQCPEGIHYPAHRQKNGFRV